MTTVKDNQGAVMMFRRVNENKTNLWFAKVVLQKKEPKIPEEAYEAKPDGISCLFFN